MLNKYCKFKYKGEIFYLFEMNLKIKSDIKGARYSKGREIGLYINNQLSQLDKQRELHRLITKRGLRQ